MQKAIVLTVVETEVWNDPEYSGSVFCNLYERIQAAGGMTPGVILLGKPNDDEPLYELESMIPHQRQDVNDSNQFYCLDCGRELGR